VGAEGLSGRGIDDGDVEGIDDEQHGGCGVVDSDAEVVEFPGSTKGEFAESVDGVDADAVVDAGGRNVGRGGFDGRVVGDGGGVAVGAVDPLGVVDAAEGVELLLQVGEGVGGRLGGEPAWQCRPSRG